METPYFLVGRYYVAFLEGDQAGMKREIDRARGNLEAEDWMSHNQALVLAHSGQVRNARTMWQHAIVLAQQNGDREKAAIYQAAEAVCEAHFGNCDAAKELARAALELGKGRDVEYAAGFALALSGDNSGSQRLAEDLAKRFPEDTPVQFEYLPTLRALFALHEKAPLDAIEWLQTALPYDLAMPGTAFFAKFGGLYPAYVRGQAYLEAGAAGRQRRNSKRSWIIAASFLPIRSARWRTCNWAEHTLSRATWPRPKTPIRISSPSGKMPTRTSPSSSRPEQNTRSCGS